VIGIAYGDASLGKLGVCEFADTDQFSNFEVCVCGSVYVHLLFFLSPPVPSPCPSLSSHSSFCSLSVSPSVSYSLSCSLQSVMIQIGARECLLANDAGNPDIAKLQQIIERAGAMVTLRKKAEFAIR
jgi:hypothetical protein